MRLVTNTRASVTRGITGAYTHDTGREGPRSLINRLLIAWPAHINDRRICFLYIYPPSYPPPCPPQGSTIFAGRCSRDVRFRRPFATRRDAIFRKFARIQFLCGSLSESSTLETVSAKGIHLEENIFLLNLAIVEE